jgi:hypothetical protein
MRQELTFNIPFSGFTTTDFINCFATTTMFLEGITGDDDYDVHATERGAVQRLRKLPQIDSRPTGAALLRV